MKFLIAIIFIFVLNINHVLGDNLYDAVKIAYKNNKELILKAPLEPIQNKS